MAAQRQSSFVAVGRASLTAAAALSLVRVFPRGSWLVPVLVAACIPPLVFALGERRRWNVVVVVAVTAVAGAWLALVVDDPSATAAGLPTTSALSTLRHDLAAAPHVLRTATVPVEPAGSALLIAVIAALIAALVTELIARRLMAPMGAIGPSVALYIAVSALGSGPWAATTAWYALAVVAYLVALQQTELSARRTWFQTGHERHSRLVSGGIAGGAVAIALAIAVGPGLPGARSAAWINYRSIGAGDGGNELKTPSPLATVSAKLSGINANEEIFTVKTSDNHPYRWRVIALDEFSSDPGSKNDWTAGGKERSARTLAGPTAQSSSRLVTQRFRLGPIDPYWLPAAYRPVAIDLANAAVLSNSTASLFLASSTLDKVSYQVTSEVANPGVQVLERATFADLRAAAADTRLPGDFPGDARALARALTKDAHTPYEQAVALESYFQRSGLFTYDTKVQLGNSPDALHTFLFVDRRGFCEQFATAYAELARAIGLPARVAVGYQSGTYDPADGLYHVRNRDAHAWPEVWLGRDIGWYAFEPTPGHADPLTGRGSAGGNSTPNTATTPTTQPASSPTTLAGTNTTPTVPGGGNAKLPSSTAAASRTRAHVVTGVLVALIALALALLAGTVALVVTALRRTRRRRHDPDTRRRVLGAWSEALERLAAAGVERRPSATSIEFALRQAPASGAGPAGPALMDLARLHTSAMYAPDPPSSDDADAAWACVDRIDAALRTVVSRTDRWKTRLRPRGRQRVTDSR